MHVAIHTKALQQGMYIACKGSLVFEIARISRVADGYVASEADKQALLAKNVAAVYIDPKRMLLPYEEADTVESPAVLTRQSHDAYLKEVEQAAELQESGLAVAHDLESRVARGEELPVQETKEIVRGMIASMSANRNVMIGLTRLKQWDAYTYTHCMNVSLYGTLLAKYMGEDDAVAEEIGVSGFFHDIGKLFVPQDIINSPGKLTPDQLKIVRKHPQYGASYSRKIPGLSDTVRLGILEHHERWDGTGYPDGKRGSSISQAGRMLLVADVYDALSSRRSYKPPMSPGDTLSSMYRERGNTYAPDLLESFIKAIGVYPPGCMVRLSDNSIALVTEQTAYSLQPRVVILIDARGEKLDPPRLLDLSREKHLTINGCPVQPQAIDLQEAVFAAG